MNNRSLESTQRRLLLAASIPGVVMLLTIMIREAYSGYLVALVALLFTALIGYCALTISRRLNYQLDTLTNLVEAMANDDFSMRGKRFGKDDALNHLIDIINGLSESMNQQRLEVRQQQYLLSKVINNIDVGIIAFDAKEQLSFINNTAARLLDIDLAESQGWSSKRLTLNELSIESILSCPQNGVIEWQFPTRSGKFQIRQERYFENGQPQFLLFITDVSQLLRGEEYKAWQNLLRVVSHEINNTLTPIASLSQVLRQLLPVEPEFRDVDDGLKIIEERAGNLKTFVESYRKLTTLPNADKQILDVAEIIKKLLPLFEHRQIELVSSKPAVLPIDPVLMEQLLINVLKNADEAMPEDLGAIAISWQFRNQYLIIEITDEGPGISNPDNLFVPFYTTKPHGTGIGLTLCRQIAEAHDGYFVLENRTDGKGGRVRITLPGRER
ncbi:PAS domain-containing sensor histidine kinase [Hahella sp. CCB-MM4]|uniref:sensor histidine kinase n=1 Tax=Hahella sp. (strain CCB-MM4) TaxID=1926491 RepID=UPI000B9B1582|nr:ATP-binding protein [Hahella sp. CCB-MM4]